MRSFFYYTVEARAVPKEAKCAPSLKKQFEELSASGNKVLFNITV